MFAGSQRDAVPGTLGPGKLLVERAPEQAVNPQNARICEVEARDSAAGFLRCGTPFSKIMPTPTSNPSDADIIFTKATIALARSQRLISSWLPPRTADELANAKTDEDMEREEQEMFTPVPERYRSTSVPLTCRVEFLLADGHLLCPGWVSGRRCPRTRTLLRREGEGRPS